MPWVTPLVPRYAFPRGDSIRLVHAAAELPTGLKGPLLAFNSTKPFGMNVRRRAAVSLENRRGKQWVKQFPSALALPCAGAVGAASPGTALDRRSECDRSSFRQDRRNYSGFSACDSQ